MSFCPNCGNEYSASAKFCNRCGASVTATAPTVVVTAYVPPVRVSSPKNIAGMILAIVGLVMGILSAVYSFFGGFFYMIMEGFAMDEMLAMFGGAGLMFAIIALPFSIVGLCISNSHLSKGSTHKTASLGKSFGVVATILAVIQLSLSILLIVLGA